MFLAGNKMEETKNKAAESIIRKKKILSKENQKKRVLLPRWPKKIIKDRAQGN